MFYTIFNKYRRRRRRIHDRSRAAHDISRPKGPQSPKNKVIRYEDVFAQRAIKKQTGKTQGFSLCNQVLTQTQFFSNSSPTFNLTQVFKFLTLKTGQIFDKYQP